MRPSGRASAAANQIDGHHHQRYNQQQVNQTPGNMQAEAQQPQNQQHSDNRPKRIDLLGLSLLRFPPLKGNVADRLPALQTNSLGPRSDQPAKWAYPL
jgi:hypothetical protein